MSLRNSGIITPLPRVTLVLGGARFPAETGSPNSCWTSIRGQVCLATAEILDEEMARRVRLHRARRDADCPDARGAAGPREGGVAETAKSAAVLVGASPL